MLFQQKFQAESWERRTSIHTHHQFCIMVLKKKTLSTQWKLPTPNTVSWAMGSWHQAYIALYTLVATLPRGVHTPSTSPWLSPAPDLSCHSLSSRYTSTSTLTSSSLYPALLSQKNLTPFHKTTLIMTNKATRIINDNLDPGKKKSWISQGNQCGQPLKSLKGPRVLVTSLNRSHLVPGEADLLTDLSFNRSARKEALWGLELLSSQL